MSALWLCTILIAVLSCGARPNMPPGFLVGNAERFPTSRRIDLPKFLQDIQEAVSKAANDARENAKQHVASMKQKHMEMIRRHFLPPLAPIPYIKERLGALNPHRIVRPDIAPCPGCLPIIHNIGSTYQPSHTYLSPCRANIFTCLQYIGSPTYRPYSSSANHPCVDKLCNQPHKKPLDPKPLHSNDPASKPTVSNNHGSFSSDKNSSNSVLEPTHHISSTSLPVVSDTTTAPSVQFTLPEKLFNLAMNITTPTKIGETTETLEDLRKNSSILENEILDTKPFELNHHLNDSVSNLKTEDKLTEDESTVPDLTTLGRNDFEKATPNNLIEEITTQKIPVPLNTLNTPEEEQKTESTSLKVIQERVDPCNTHQPFSKISTGENVVTLPTTYKVNSVIKETDQDQTTEKTNERAEIDDLLNTTGEPLFVTENMDGNAKYHETTPEPVDKTIYETSTAPVVHEHVTVTTDEKTEKVLDKQATTTETNGAQVTVKNELNVEIRQNEVSTAETETTIPEEYYTSSLKTKLFLDDNSSVIIGESNLDKQATTTETNGAQVTVKNELNVEIRQNEVSTAETETTIPEEYYTSSLKTKLFLDDNSSVTLGFPETTTINNVLSSSEDIFSGFYKITNIDEYTTERGEFRTTVDVKDYKEIELELERSTDILDSVTKIDEKLDQTPVDVIEGSTKSSGILKEESNLETSVKSVEMTTEVQKEFTTLYYESRTDDDENLFETTTSSVLYTKGARNEENYNFQTTTDDSNDYEVTAKESGDILKGESHGIPKEEEFVNHIVANNTKELNSSKINVENQTQPFGILKERYSSNDTSDPKNFTTATSEQLTTASVTEYNEEVIESRSEVYPGSSDRFETTTNIEHYLEGSTQPFVKGLGNVDSTDGNLEATTVSVDGEDVFTELYDLRSAGLTSASTGYQDGVLKFTTELDSETDASPTDNSNPPFPAILQKTLRKVRDKPTRLRLSGFSPVQSAKKCIDFVDCLISKSRSKRSPRNIIKALSSGKNIPSSNTNFLNLSYPLLKEKRSNVETSGLYAPALLELLPVVREGYRNDAFNEDDKKIIRSIFGDLGSRAVEEKLDGTKEVKGDLLMKDATARIDVLLEDDDYDSSEMSGDKSQETEHRLKRSKKAFQLITSTVEKTPNNHRKSSNIKAPSQRYRRDIRSSEAAAILALLAEQSDVQLDAPDDDEDDYYEYYDDEGGVNVALEEDSSTADEGGYENEEYDEPSFVELIKLARRHSQRKSRQES